MMLKVIFLTAVEPLACMQFLVSRIGEALRLQAQGRFCGAVGERRSPTAPQKPRVPRFRFPASANDRIKNKGPVLAHGAFVFNPVVETAGIEPASASTLQTVLHT